MARATKKAAAKKPMKSGAAKPPPATPYDKRKAIYKSIEIERKSRVLCYVTGDRKNLETQVSTEIVKLFVSHLDALFPAKKISLVLYTKGGNTLAAWSLINMLRMFCDELEIIVPSVALSAGTLMCLGADRIVMTKQAMLGPIDPSITGPLNPLIPGAGPNARAPVSVEAVKGYIEMAKADFGVKDMTPVLVDLAQKVHPLLLGAIFRSKSQIQALAGQFLNYSVKDKAQQKKIIDFLCSESGSHDYTINRREADALGLRVEKCSPKLYRYLSELQNLIDEELELNQPFDPNSILAGQPAATYNCVRCIIEGTSIPGHTFSSEGTLTKVTIAGPPGAPPQDAVHDQRTFEGWRQR